jgi:hypothetical protein
MHNADYSARARGASSGRRSKMERVRCRRARGNPDLGRPGHRPAPAVSGVCRCGRAGRGPVVRWVMATAGFRLRDRARKNGARLKTSRWSADRRPAFSKSNAGRADWAEVQASVLVARIPRRCASRRSAPLTGAKEEQKGDPAPSCTGRRSVGCARLFDIVNRNDW